MHACSVRTSSQPKSTNSQRKECAKRGIFLTRLKPPRAVKWKIAKVSSSDEDGGAVGRNGFIANAHIIIKCIAVERENYTFPARRRGVGEGENWERQNAEGGNVVMRL